LLRSSRDGSESVEHERALQHFVSVHGKFGPIHYGGGRPES
jgi:hypothetical protein